VTTIFAYLVGKPVVSAITPRPASGHQSDRYIWRYVNPDQHTLAETIDELE